MAPAPAPVRATVVTQIGGHWNMSSKHTFLFADLAGYTALTEAHGDEAAADLAADFSSQARELAAAHDAHFVKSIGDAVLVAPHGASEAVCLGLHLAQEIGRRTGSAAVRVGMHTGQAVKRDGDWFGAAVNLAARVGELAEAGQVLLTSDTREAAGSLTTIQLEDLGEHTFRHVREPIRILAASRSTDSARDLAVDPECHMLVDHNDATATRLHDGRRIYFCSSTCAERFDAERQRATDQQSAP